MSALLWWPVERDGDQPLRWQAVNLDHVVAVRLVSGSEAQPAQLTLVLRDGAGMHTLFGQEAERAVILLGGGGNGPTLRTFDRGGG